MGVTPSVKAMSASLVFGLVLPQSEALLSASEVDLMSVLISHLPPRDEKRAANGSKGFSVQGKQAVLILSGTRGFSQAKPTV